jgi:hypothetical protein
MAPPVNLPLPAKQFDCPPRINDWCLRKQLSWLDDERNVHTFSYQLRFFPRLFLFLFFIFEID